MPDNFEVIYSHPSGATATFVRQGGELDALAKGLDSEQFWVFKNVKSLLARNEPGDLAEANRLMSGIGFTPLVREITPAQPARSAAAMRDEALAGAAAVPAAATAHGAVEEHAGPHEPQPSYWPLLLAIWASVALIGLVFLDTTLLITAVGLVGVLVSIIGWGVEPFHVEL
jgi:hypothetical protein